MTDLNDLTRRNFLAVLIHELQNPDRASWLWLCLNETAKKERIEQAEVYYQEWKANELLMQEQRRQNRAELNALY